MTSPHIGRDHTRPLRALLVTHEASRTGAPRVAVNVARVASSQGAHVFVVVRWPGPLTADFRATGAKVANEPLRRLRAVLRMRARTRRLAVMIETLVASVVIAVVRPHVVYANTCLSACYVRPALWWGRRPILHVHELEPLASSVLARYHLAGRWDQVEVVACSSAVATNTERIIGRPVDAVVPSVPDIAAVVSKAGARNTRASDGVVVGGCGLPNAGKGVDLFARVAEITRRQRPDVRFTWVGGDAPSEVATSPVEFVGPLDNPYPVMATFDVFAMTSRQDAFPLVVIEAMALGVPVVAFDVGGVREQLGADGILVPAGDTQAFADALLRLLSSEEERRHLGDALARRARDRFDMMRFEEAVGHLIFGGQSTAPPA